MNDGRTESDRGAGGAPAADETVSADERMPAPRENGATHGGSGPDAALPELTRTRLGSHLRTLYDQVVQQPVPDRFRDLIARLEAGDAVQPSDNEPEAGA